MKEFVYSSQNTKVKLELESDKENVYLLEITRECNLDLNVPKIEIPDVSDLDKSSMISVLDDCITTISKSPSFSDLDFEYFAILKMVLLNKYEYLNKKETRLVLMYSDFDTLMMVDDIEIIIYKRPRTLHA